MPLNVGEFGPIYEKPEVNPGWEVQNAERYKMLDKQMAIYTEEAIGKSPKALYPISRHLHVPQHGVSGPTKTSTLWA